MDGGRGILLSSPGSNVDQELAALGAGGAGYARSAAAGAGGRSTSSPGGGGAGGRTSVSASATMPKSATL
jgi:hypothetical protein